MSPIAPPPSHLHPWPHHLPHPHYHYLLDYWKLKNWKRIRFKIIYFTTRGSDRFWNLNCFSTETTKYFMHPFLYMITSNLAYYQFLTLHNDGKIEGNKYLQFTTFYTLCHVWKSHTNKTIFQRTHKETFQSTFNHKM